MRIVGILIGLCLLMAVPVMAQEQPGSSGNPIVTYDGHQIEIEPEKGPVQTCVVEVTTVENLDTKNILTKILVIGHTDNGWEVMGLATDNVTGKTQGTDINDCGHNVWDEDQ